MKKQVTHFNVLARVLHWLMAFLILSMLFIGAFMVTSLANRSWLIDLHRPLGIAIFLLLIIRVVNRWLNPQPPLPSVMPVWQRTIANATHWLMYGLIFCLPLIGWGMLSAGDFPVKLFGGLNLPPIAPVNPTWYAWLRLLHSLLAWALFAIVLGHLSMAFLHALMYKDGLLTSMIKRRPDQKNKC